MTVFTLVITRRGATTREAVAIVAPEGRYAAVQWTHLDRLERMFAPAAAWHAMEAEIGDCAKLGPLEPTAGIVVLLVGDRASSLEVDCVKAELIEVPPLRVAPILDAQLQALAAL